MVVARISATLSILWRRRPLQRWPPAGAWGRTAAFPTVGADSKPTDGRPQSSFRDSLVLR